MSLHLGSTRAGSLQSQTGHSPIFISTKAASIKQLFHQNGPRLPHARSMRKRCTLGSDMRSNHGQSTKRSAAPQIREHRTLRAFYSNQGLRLSGNPNSLESIKQYIANTNTWFASSTCEYGDFLNRYCVQGNLDMVSAVRGDMFRCGFQCCPLETSSRVHSMHVV